MRTSCRAAPVPSTELTSTAGLTPWAAKSCTALTRWARLRPRRSSFPAAAAASLEPGRLGCPRSATSYSAGAAAWSRSPEEAPVDPSPAPVDRGGPRALARRPDLALAGADGASATALQPRPHLWTTLPAPAWGRTVRLPCDGGHGPPEAAERNRCRSRAAWASGQGWRRRSWGGWSNESVERGRPAACPTAGAVREAAPSRSSLSCEPAMAPRIPPPGTDDERGVARPSL